VFVNPVWLRPDQIRHQRSITTADIVCPRAGMVEKAGDPVWRYYEDRRLEGKEFWLFSCYGPTRPADPSRYYRKLAWLAWAKRANGIGFWSLIDLGGVPSSWDEYHCARSSFSPVYLAPDQVTPALQLEAIAEGVSDYGLLLQLRRLAENNRDAAALCREIETGLGTVDLVVPKSVLSQLTDGWHSADARKLDAWRNRALDLLEAAAVP